MAPASTIPKDPQNSARATGRRTPLQGIILTHNALTPDRFSTRHGRRTPLHATTTGLVTARPWRGALAWAAALGGTACSSSSSASAARRCSHPTPPCTPPAARTSHSGQKPMPSSRATGRSAEHALLQRHAVQRNHRRYDGVEDVRLEGDQLATSDGGQRVEQQLISTDLPGWRPRFRAARTSCRRTRQ